MKEAIQSLISKGAISVLNPCPQQFISTLFPVEKGQGTGEFRPVINLKALNRFLPKEKFKMEGLHTARSLLRKGDYMLKLDLRDALLCGPDTPGVEEISSFPVQGNNLPVPLPAIWPLPGPPSLHQNPLSNCRQTAFRGDTNSHLLGRSSPDSPSEGLIERDFPLCEETFVQPGFPSETREMLSRTNSSLGLSGCSFRHNLHVSGSTRGTDQLDTGSMPGNARVSVNIPGWTVEPLGPHEPCRTDRPVDSTIRLQSPAAPAGSAASPVRMETKVSDVIVSTLPGGPEMVGVPDSARAQ